MQRFTSPSCVDVQLGQRQGEGQLPSLGVGGTLQDVVHGVPASRPAGGDEVCVRGLNIRHRSCIVHTTATTTRRAAVTLFKRTPPKRVVHLRLSERAKEFIIYHPPNCVYH